MSKTDGVRSLLAHPIVYAQFQHETFLTATAREWGAGLWTLTRMCSITQTDATSKCKKTVVLYNA